MSADSQELEDWSKELGTHLIVELYGAKNLFLPDPSIPILRQAAIDCGAEILDDMFHDFGDRYGFTGVIILSEPIFNAAKTFPKDIVEPKDLKPNSIFEPILYHIYNEDLKSPGKKVSNNGT